MSALRTMLAVVLATAAAGCVGDGNEALQRELARRQQRFDATAGDTTRGTSAAVARWILPASMSEVSGLALTPDGRLLAHDDERGRITVIDPARGVVLKRFHLERGSRADFEGITMYGDTIVLVTSNGWLYTFGEGADDAAVPFRAFDTHLGKECEFEGVVFDAARSQLLLPCKRIAEKDLRDDLLLFHVPLPLTRSVAPESQRIPLDGVEPVRKGLHPTDITRDPRTGNFIIVAAPERALIELSPSGEVRRAATLPRLHVQAEGVAMRPDGVLVVSDEAQALPAALTLYRWPLTRSDAP